MDVDHSQKGNVREGSSTGAGSGCLVSIDGSQMDSKDLSLNDKEG